MIVLIGMVRLIQVQVHILGLVQIVLDDSIATLYLTINNSSDTIFVETSCDSYVWTDGQTYTSSGTYIWSGINRFGCDSISTLILTINNTSIYVDTLFFLY